MYCKSQLRTALLRHFSSLLRNLHIYCSPACHVCIAIVHHNTVLTPFAIYHQGCCDACTTTSHCVMQNAQQLAVYRHMSLCLVGDMWPPYVSRIAISPRSACIAMYCHSWRALAVYIWPCVTYWNISQHIAMLHWLSKPCSLSIA